MPVYEVNGQQINAVEAGSASRQKAILIHGWSSSSYALSPLMGILSQRFHCIAVDLPGYGKSPPLNKRVTIDDYADLMAALIEQISDGPVVLVGHSMGGMTSITIANKYPVLVERMVLLSPTITGVLSNTINMTVFPINLLERFGLSLLVTSVEKIYVGITDRLMRPISFADRTAIEEDQYALLRADARQIGGGRTRYECFFAMREHDLSGHLGNITVPTLAIWGAEDNTVPLRDAGVVADEWPEADLRILPNAGHWPHFESPDTVRRLVASFLGLPLLTNALYEPVEDAELAKVQETAQFLAHSSIGNNLSLPQRTRLAAQLRQYVYPPYRTILKEDVPAEMFIVQAGVVEVWSEPDEPSETPKQPQRISTLKPGDMTGELAMIDQGERTADLISGAEGAVVLALSRDRILALAEDDPELGSKVLWNLALAMTTRVRFILWQLQRANMRARAEQKLWEQEREQQARLLAQYRERP